jgi:glucose/arabinose dehydrogenase
MYTESIMKKILFGVLFVFVLGAGYYLYDYLGFVNRTTPVVVNHDSSDQTDTSFPSDSSDAAKAPVAYTVEPFVSNLYVPWSIVFTSSERMLVTERNGKVRVVEKGVLQAHSLASFPIATSGEEGLMGMTLDPDYSNNKYVYVVYAYAAKDGSADRVVRLVDEGSTLRVDQTIFEGIPAAQFHAGSRIKFGPDGKLYITAGDATHKELAQNKSVLNGKILRINSDGTIPQDNPFPNSPIWSYGHRNPQGIDWHPVTKTLWETEHGPSGNDGPGGGDEVNVIEKGANYGWPVVSHGTHRDGMIDPQILYTPAIAPASGMFYSADVFPQFKNNFLYGGLRGSGIYRAVVSADGKKVLSHEKLAGVDVGRVRDVVTGPDGYIYFTTSNRDGRGIAQNGDDRVYRLVPKK